MSGGVLCILLPLLTPAPSQQLLPDAASFLRNACGAGLNVNCRYTTAAFTLSPEPWASLCVANLPGDWALYAVSVPLDRLGTGLTHSFALRLPSDGSSRFRPCLRLVLVSMYLTLTGFTYRGLSPHKFTPVMGVHYWLPTDRRDAC